MSLRRRTPPGLPLPEVEKAVAELRELRDDMALRRVWAHVASPEEAEAARGLRPSPRRGLWFVGGAVTAAGLAAFALWLRPAPSHLAVSPKEASRPIVGTSLHAAPAKVEASSTAANVPSGTLVRRGEAVRSTRESLPLVLPGGAGATLAPGSALKVEADGRVVLAEGGSRFDVPLQTQSMVVDVGSFRVVVAGTRFKVELAPHGAGVSVAVESGTAEIFGVRDLGLPLAHLSPGSRWSNKPDQAEPVGPSSTEPAAATDVNGDVMSRVMAEKKRHHRPATRMVGAAGVSTGTTASGDLGVASENAAYERGRVLRDVQQRPQAALEAWRACRAEHPAGVLRPEVDLSIFETLVRGRDVAGALSEGSAFLTRYPESERRSEVARLMGDLYRSRGESRRAVEAYDAALAAHPSRELEDQIAFARAVAFSQGGLDRGESVKAYLDTHPSGRHRKAAAKLLSDADARTP